MLEEIKNPNSIEFDGIYFTTKYNTFEETRRSLEEMPTPEMAEAVRVEYRQNPGASIFSSCQGNDKVCQIQLCRLFPSDGCCDLGIQTQEAIYRR